MWKAPVEASRGYEVYAPPNRQRQHQQRHRNRLQSCAARMTGKRVPLLVLPALLFLVIIMPFVLLSHRRSDGPHHLEAKLSPLTATRSAAASSMAMPPPMTSSTDERASSPPDIDGMCSSYASCHTTRVFIAIQSRLGRSEQRSLVRRTWLKWAKRYNKDNVEHGSQRVPIAWRFFLHGSVGITNETSKEPLMQTELRVEKDLVLASMKLHNQPKAPSTTRLQRAEEDEQTPRTEGRRRTPSRGVVFSFQLGGTSRLRLLAGCLVQMACGARKPVASLRAGDRVRDPLAAGGVAEVQALFRVNAVPSA